MLHRKNAENCILFCSEYVIRPYRKQWAATIYIGFIDIMRQGILQPIAVSVFFSLTEFQRMHASTYPQCTEEKFKFAFLVFLEMFTN
jgi:hypothetical protein